MPVKLLLINAPVLAIFEPWFDKPDFVRTSLATLAGYIRSRSSISVQCLDAKFEGLSFNDTVEKVVQLDPDYIGFTAFTNEIKPSAYLAGLIKQVMPKSITIIGGAHITAMPQSTLKEFPTFDYGIFGEGEETLLEFIKAHSTKSTIETIEGLVYRNGNDVIKNNERHRILDQDELPMPAWDLLPKAKEYYIQTIRGCPFTCVFCLNHNGRVARKRSVEKVVSEMEWLIDYAAPKRISFGDELFSIDINRTEELLDLMIEREIGKKVSWDIQTHVAYVNDTLFKKMKLANISKCEMGVEAGDNDILRKMGKGTNLDMIVRSFKLAKKYGIPTGSFLLLGQPNETLMSMWNTIKIGILINPAEPIIGTMVPYPGTEVAKLAAKGEAGFQLITTNWDEYRKQLNGSLEFKKISRRTIEMFQIFGYIIIFIANLRFFDLAKFIFLYLGGGWQLLRKIISGKKTTTEIMNLPHDYHAVINSKHTITMEEIIDARSYWNNVQKTELKYAKEIKPQLLNEQQPPSG